MRKVLVAIVLFLLVGGPAAAWPVVDEPDGPDDIASRPNSWTVHDRAQAELRQIIEKSRRGGRNYSIIAQHLRAVIDDLGFSTLNPAEQHYAYLLYAGALFNIREFETARLPIERASEMPQSGAQDWELRLENSLEREDYGDAARAATVLAQRWPDQLKRYDDKIFATIAAETKKRPDTAELATGLLAALSAAHRAPPAN